MAKKTETLETVLSCLADAIEKAGFGKPRVSRGTMPMIKSAISAVSAMTETVKYKTSELNRQHISQTKLCDENNKLREEVENLKAKVKALETDAPADMVETLLKEALHRYDSLPDEIRGDISINTRSKLSSGKLKTTAEVRLNTHRRRGGYFMNPLISMMDDVVDRHTSDGSITLMETDNGTLASNIRALGPKAPPKEAEKP